MRQHAVTLLVVIGQLAGGYAAAQDAPPAVAEHYGMGALGAIGWPGPLVALRLSGPMTKRFGYGFDWQARGGTRLGLELAGGGTGESLGLRLFVRVFALWGRPVTIARAARNLTKYRPARKADPRALSASAATSAE